MKTKIETERNDEEDEDRDEDRRKEKLQFLQKKKEQPTVKSALKLKFILKF